MRERYRITTAVVSRAGNVVLMGPTFEKNKMQGAPIDAEVVVWSDEDDQYARMAEWIRGHGGEKPRIGLESTTDYYHYAGLRAVLRDASFEDATFATDALRAVKSPAEIACLRAAVQKTMHRMDQVPSLLRIGMTERELARAYGPGAMVQFGPGTSRPNGAAGDRRLEQRDIIVIDAGDWVLGYRSDITRTFFFGEPSAKMREVYSIVDEARLAAIEAAKPGAPAGNVDRAAKQVIERAGYGPYYLHRGGHGIGLGFHEIPICAERSEDVLAVQMVLTVEPGIYIAGEFGVRLEDNLVITDNGNELLN